KKVAYLLWLLVGWTGAHRFYAGETKTGAIQLVMALSVIGLPFLVFWLIADIFLIPGMINDKNMELIRALNASDRPGLDDELEHREEMVAPALDGKRARMLEDLRATGYLKPRRDFSKL
ncbi:MAG: TM2 domain-containing protein, partial [Pseudomonadota bacterium]